MFVAALIASAVPALLFGALGFIFEPNNGWAGIAMVVAFVVSLAHTLVFGVPCVLLFKKAKILNWYSMLGAGLIFGALFYCLRAGEYCRSFAWAGNSRKVRF